MNNGFSFYSTDDKNTVDFLKSVVQSSNTILDHYSFVLNDISSTISDPKLESTKGPTVEFLTAMKNKWEEFRDDAAQKLDNLLASK